MRATSGISTDLISDTDFTLIGEEAEYELERLMNTAFTPRTVIEEYEGNGTNRLVLKKNPVLRVRNLKIDTTDVSVSGVEVDKEAGVIWLDNGAEESVFKTNSVDRYLVKIKYDFGLRDDDVSSSSTTETSAAVVAGSSVSIPVISSAGFSSGDYARIIGLDGNEETFKITGVVDLTHVTADVLVLGHESTSMVIKQVVPKIAERFGYVIGALMGVARVVGASFDEVTGWTLGDWSVQKGEPYTQWRETAMQLKDEYKRLLEMFRPRAVVR